MYHIRFLKFPQLVVPKESGKKAAKPAKNNTNGGKSLKTVITITNDLGEKFFFGEVSLKVVVYHLDGDNQRLVLSEKEVLWQAGFRSVISEVENIEQLSRQARSAKTLIQKRRKISSGYDKGHFSSYSSESIFVSVEAINAESVVDLLAGDDDDDNEEHDLKRETAFVEFLSITSSPLHLDGDDPDARYAMRQLDLNTDRPLETVLHIVEETGESIAKHLWDAGIYACRRMFTNQASDFFTPATVPRNILELGTGCGTVGISLALIFPESQVTLTDLEDAKVVCERSIYVNRKLITPNGKDDCRDTSRVHFEELDWASPTPPAPKLAPFKVGQTDATNPGWDVIVVSDCTYNPDSYEILLTLLKRTATNQTRILLAHKYRHPRESQFFDMLTEYGFGVKQELYMPGVADKIRVSILQKVE